MTKIYYAHPFDTWINNFEMEKHIQEILESYDYDVVNPFVRESQLNEKYGVDNYYDNPCIGFAKDIVEKDYEAVEECDELFAWIPQHIVAIGTTFEIAYAHSLNKKITILTYKPHPFLLKYADVLYTSFEDFVKNEPHEWVNNNEANKNQS